ncbi:hypothetical protein BKA66DRAFT_454797 [Pyrenochaeta sp. MPI-SDFR-AT-0127]|nr:hypothetical protein BKA66DRAFT_454797 [Pyrenochaeta sp. MPI-SDFR-AT-0127]
MSRRLLGDEHPDTLSSMNSLAYTLHSQSRTDEAISLMEKVLQLRQRILGPDHPRTEESLQVLSCWRMQQVDLGS